ncbi:MAG: hypothetical protein HY021_08565 [Burkholderiales bacterium]|nr:hypothetical protein [Burkholderiales bacterium]
MSKSLTRWLATSAALGLVAVAAQAQQPAKAPSAHSPGMVVVRDAETGQLRAPTGDEAKALQQQAKLSAAGRKRAQAVAAPAVERALGGGAGYALEVDESTHSYSVAVRQPDGSVALDCVTGADTAKKLVAGKRAVSNKTSKEDGHAHVLLK